MSTAQYDGKDCYLLALNRVCLKELQDHRIQICYQQSHGDPPNSVIVDLVLYFGQSEYLLDNSFWKVYMHYLTRKQIHDLKQDL